MADGGETRYFVQVLGPRPQAKKRGMHFFDRTLGWCFFGAFPCTLSYAPGALHDEPSPLVQAPPPFMRQRLPVARISVAAWRVATLLHLGPRNLRTQ